MDDRLLDNGILCLTEAQCGAGSDTISRILTTVIINAKVLFMVCEMM